MDKDLINLLQEITGEELEEEEIEELEDGLDKDQQSQLQTALQTFFDNSEETPNPVNKAAAVLTLLIIALAAQAEEEEKPEEAKKVEKSRSWSFTLAESKED